MDKRKLGLYTDYLIGNYGYATATGLSAMVNGAVSHDQITRFLSEREYTSKDLWLAVKSAVRQIEQDDGLNAKTVGEQLIIDIAKYKKHPQCRRLVCFVYDPEGRITNPAGIESDLNSGDHGIEVMVSILPKAAG